MNTSKDLLNMIATEAVETHHQRTKAVASSAVVQRCRSCRRWQPNVSTRTDHGRCMFLEIHSDEIMTFEGRIRIEPHADFGCVHHSLNGEASNRRSDA